MNQDLLSRFGKMFPDYSHPALVESAEGNAKDAEHSPGQMMTCASFAEVMNLRDEFYRSIEGPTSLRSFPRLGSSGIVEHGQCLTLNSLALHSADDAYSVCSLAQILEPDVAQKYFLSPRACRGILRRAEKRGRNLPPMLRQALEMAAMDGADGREITKPDLSPTL